MVHYKQWQIAITKKNNNNKGKYKKDPKTRPWLGKDHLWDVPLAIGRDLTSLPLLLSSGRGPS